jgi:molybdate transport system permease protein
MARRGLLAGLILAWARALGEFGATLMLAGATRFKTATLPITVFLNIGTGELEAAVACAWVLLLAGFIMLFAMRLLGKDRYSESLAKGVGI